MPGDPQRQVEVEQRRSAADDELTSLWINVLESALGLGAQVDAIVGDDLE